VQAAGFFVSPVGFLTGLFLFAMANPLQRKPAVEALIMLLLKVLWDVVWYCIRKHLDRKDDKQS